MIKKSLAQAVVARLQNSKPFWLADVFTAFCASDKIGLIYPMLGRISEQNQSDIFVERWRNINVTMLQEMQRQSENLVEQT